MGRTFTPGNYRPVTSDDFEQLPIVDENDIEVGSARRAEIHRRAWRHRAVHIVVVNSSGQVLLQRRSLIKDSYPGFWDISVGGHVAVGETYEEAARRELREELEAEGSLQFIGKIPASAKTGWEFVEVYCCRHEGPFSPPKAEIAEVKWMDPGDILNRAALDRAWQITPSAVHTIRFWRKAAENGRSDA